MKLAPSFSELNTASRPIKEPCAEPILKLTDATAHRRFGDSEAFRACSKPTSGNYRIKNSQIFEPVHLPILKSQAGKINNLCATAEQSVLHTAAIGER